MLGHTPAPQRPLRKETGGWVRLRHLRPPGSRAWQSRRSRGSAAFGVPSADLTERANNPVMRALMQMEDGQLIPQQGAVPIKRGNELIGAIGVSGASSQEDEEIARAGLAAL